MTKYISYIILVLLGVFAWAACTSKSNQANTQASGKSETNVSAKSIMESSGKSVMATISNIDSLSTFNQMLDAADLAQTLQEDGSYTVFAPTNKALKKLPDGILEVLLKPESKERLAGLLKVHMAKGVYLFSDFRDQQKFNSMEEEVELNVRKKNGATTISQAQIILPGIKTTNGIIYIIDRFIVNLQPPASGN